MVLTSKSIILFVTILITGLSAGFFYAWAVTVIPGTRKVLDLPYLLTMQSINREILNPSFFLIFFGSMIFMAISAIQHFQHGWTFWILLAAFLSYLIGAFGVTAFGNVPLNEALDAIHLSELSTQELAQYRQNYELSWNRWHMIRTCFSVVSFGLTLLALFINSKSL